MLAERHIVLGVSGGVAAYKAAYLARRLVERGAEVKLVVNSLCRLSRRFGPRAAIVLVRKVPIDAD